MKYILILFFLSTSLLADSLTIVPSVFYTYSNSSFGSNGNSVAGYFSFETHTNNWLVGSYDNLSINHNEWDYNQQLIVFGNILYLEPIFIKGYFGNINGKYASKVLDYNNSDKTNFFQIETNYQMYPYYFGLSYNYLKLNGFLSREVNNYSAKFDWIPHWRILIAPYFNYTNINDDRNLFGFGLKLNYLLFYDLLLKANIFKGERAYSFDSETITIFNQDETQNLLLSIKGEYFFTYGFSLNAAYLYTKFNDYNINYFSLGLKGLFNY